MRACANHSASGTPAIGADSGPSTRAHRSPEAAVELRPAASIVAIVHGEHGWGLCFVHGSR